VEYSQLRSGSGSTEYASVNLNYTQKIAKRIARIRIRRCGQKVRRSRIDAVNPMPLNGLASGSMGQDQRLTNGQSQLPILVDIETVSHSLGISTRQVRRFVAEGQIPFVRVGHLIRFDSDELNRWIDDRRSGLMQESASSHT
jgi:excisionase family DNA binding protein